MLNRINDIKRTELVVSKNLSVWNAIQSNISQTLYNNVEFLSVTKISEIDRYRKLDLLILDDSNITDIMNKLWIKTIIVLDRNLSTKTILHNKVNQQITLGLPCHLSSLLDIIYNDRARSKVFCYINNHFIYDQQLATIYDDQVKYKLTTKENELLATLIRAENHQISKEDLLRNVWQYNSESSSNTIETHIYRLKQKLPANFLQYKDNYYRLLISNIE